MREIERAWDEIKPLKERNGDTLVSKKSELYTDIDRSIKKHNLKHGLYEYIGKKLGHAFTKVNRFM